MGRYDTIAFYRIHCGKKKVNNNPEQNMQRYSPRFDPHKSYRHIHTTKLQYIRQIEC